MGIAIERRLSLAGYRMLGESVEDLIAEILKTKNARYLKAIPFLIYKHKPDIEMIPMDKLFQEIIYISKRLFLENNISGYLSGYEGTPPKVLDYNEFKDEFELQLRNDSRPILIDKEEIYRERSLEMHLSRLFTRKEKEMIKRLLQDKPISKTDYEYYSRKTKKKLQAIVGLHQFAQALSEKTPRYDEELYRLKKLLEDGKGELLEYFASEGIVNYKILGEKEVFLQKKLSLFSKKDQESLKRYGKFDFRLS